MKEYPSIPGSAKAPKDQCIAFYKYDGSNLRFEWQRKKGWCKFGTRHRLFDQTDEVFGEAISLFNETVAPKVDPILRKEYRDAQEITAYCEFFGKESFAGQHKPNDPKQLKLFDVNILKRGLVLPREFVKLFGKLDIAAEVVYEGNLNEQFIKDVKEGKYNVWEGVVCKGGTKHDLWMCKIKTNAYLQKLKEVYADKWESYWE